MVGLFNFNPNGLVAEPGRQQFDPTGAMLGLMAMGNAFGRRPRYTTSISEATAPDDSGMQTAMGLMNYQQQLRDRQQRQALEKERLDIAKGADQRAGRLSDFQYGEQLRKSNAEKELAAAIASGDPARVAAARAAANPEAAWQTQFGWQKPQGQIDQERTDAEWKSNLGIRQAQQGRVKTPEELAQEKAAADQAAERSIRVNAANQAAAASSPTQDIKDFQFAQKNGFAGTFQEWKQGKTANLEQSAQQRAALAASQGLTPGSPAYQSFVLTGKMPREDQQPLTATDKKAILEADEGVLAANMGIASLKRAKEISAKAYEGPTAALRGYATSMIGNEGGLATVDLDNEVTTNALSQMKAIFGGNPTEGERKILLDVQGASKLPHAARVKIFDRAILAMEARLKFNQQRAADLRGGDFYKAPSQGGSNGAAQSDYKSKYGLD